MKNIFEVHTSTDRSSPNVVKPASYRPDIDGLRAVAVLAVVAYHLNKSLLPGGFVGVDIFFVISGFLITRNIWGEMESGRFSLLQFYQRRIRRIAPAFLAMTAITLTAGAMLLLPDDLHRLGQSALWGLLSVSNVYFWKYLDTGYFAESSDEEPLLHTWSLGVEEQFYFIWPAILMLVIGMAWRRKGAMALATVICAGSFVFGELNNASSPQFTYFMLPARAGELMIGALLALRGQKNIGTPLLNAAWLNETIAVAGFALIGYALVGLNDSSSFPGINALYPCAGAALVMLAGEGRSRIVASILVQRPMVFVGLISYSLYLWHWPILAFGRYFLGSIGIKSGALAVASMFIVAWLSYRFVELPARRWQAPRMKQVFALYLVPSIALCVASATVVLTGGLKGSIEGSQAYSEGLARMHLYTSPANESVAYNCIVNSVDASILGQPRCLTGKLKPNQGEADVLLWGDSLAAHYLGTLSVFAKEDGFLLRNATHSACPPVFGNIDYGMERFRASCSEFRPMVQASILSGNYRTVIISGGWFQYDQEPKFRSDIRRTIDEIVESGSRVVIIGQTPWMSSYNRECSLRSVRLSDGLCQTQTALPDPGESDINRHLADLARQDDRISYLSIHDVLCRDGFCSPYVDERPVYYDKSHMSMSGSWFVGRKLFAGPERESWSSALGGSSALASPSGRALSSKGGKDKFRPRTMSAILGGYLPNFPHHMRSERNAISKNGPAGIVLEYWGLSSEQVVASVSVGLGERGFTEISRGPSGSALRMKFARDGYPEVSVNIGPSGSLDLQAPEATGTVYYRW